MLDHHKDLNCNLSDSLQNMQDTLLNLEELKKESNAVILAHYYQDLDVQYVDVSWMIVSLLLNIQ